MSSNAPDMPPIVIAVSLPITCAETWVTTSQITGLTLPGMIDEPFCSSGRISSPSPARGPEPIQRRSFAIFVSEAATTLSAPEVSISASRFACASKWSSGAAIGQPRAVREQRAHALRELGVGVQAGAGRGAAERDLAEPRERVLDASAPEPDLRGVAAELLAERHGHGVHQVRAAGLDVVGERLGLGRQRRLQLAERRQEVVGRRVERRQVDGRGEHVVRRLPEVHVVVRRGRPRPRARR